MGEMFTSLALAAGLAASPVPDYGARLERFAYPFPVETFQVAVQRQQLDMAFMDVPSPRPNGRTVLLLHGKNFCAATWEQTIRRLNAAGYRVIAPDQIGFCKSSKPAAFQYSFEALASATADLLAARGVGKAIVVGHSMGGMLATRFALAHPARVERLILVNPIGLEDWRAKGVPYAPLDKAYAAELKASQASIKAYQQRFYYAGAWKPDYDRWVAMLAGQYAGEGRETTAWSQALTSEMIYTQPVVHEFARITAPTTLIIGQQDRTAPGVDRAAPDLARTLGDYVALGREAARRIPGARLVPLERLGHAPQIEAPETFHRALLAALER